MVGRGKKKKDNQLELGCRGETKSFEIKKRESVVLASDLSFEFETRKETYVAGR